MNIKQKILFLLFALSIKNQLIAQPAMQQFWALNQTQFLLDQLPTASTSVAYSVRKLKKNYTGNAILVRRATTGNPEGNVAFDTRGVVSANSIITITSAGGGLTVGSKITFSTFYSGASVFVKTWYDQSGNGRNVTQTTTSQQPRIVNAGTLDVSNSIASIKFTASSSTVLLATIAASSMFGSGYIGTLSSVIEASSGNRSAFGYGNGTDRWQAHMNEGGFIRFDVGNSYTRLSSPTNAAFQGVLSNYLLIAGGSPSMQVYRNGSSIATATSSLSACTRNDFSIGGIPGFGGSYYHDDNMSEVIIFAKALTTKEISVVQNNQKTFYSTP